MKLLILTTNQSVLKWKTLNYKLDVIKETLNKVTNSSWEIEVKYQDLKPVVTKEGRLDHKWFNSVSYPLFKADNEFVGIHFTTDKWRSLNLRSSLRGANQIDEDYVGELYFKADENTKRGNKLNQFIQVVLHEIWHELCRSCGVKDDLHSWHKDNIDITKADWSVFDLNNWQKTYQSELKQEVSRLTTILEGLKLAFKTPKLLHPVPEQYRRITQDYGVYNPIYTQTKHHIGIDYATPTGTNLIAPCDGTIYRVGKSAIMGNFLEMTFTFKGKKYALRMAHLDKLPTTKQCKAGDVIAVSGNTGMSSGSHLHLDVWNKEVNLAGITQYNFRDRTLSFEELYKS